MLERETWKKEKGETEEEGKRETRKKGEVKGDEVGERIVRVEPLVFIDLSNASLL